MMWNVLRKCGPTSSSPQANVHIDLRYAGSQKNKTHKNTTTFKNDSYWYVMSHDW